MATYMKIRVVTESKHGRIDVIEVINPKEISERTTADLWELVDKYVSGPIGLMLFGSATHKIAVELTISPLPQEPSFTGMAIPVDLSQLFGGNSPSVGME